MKQNLKNLVGWLVILSALFNKYFNLNPFLGLPKINNFLDNLISSADIVVLTLSLWFFAMTMSYNYHNTHTRYFVQPTISHLFVIVSLLFSFLINPSFGLLMIIARIFLLINIIPKLLNHSNHLFRVTLLIALILGLVFDHFLLSSSLPVVLLFILSFTPTKSQKIGIWIYLALNLVLAIYQVTSGKSLGLIYFGEPVLDSNSLNIARENLFGVNILRGYGLTQHPVILGFVAVFGLLFDYKNHFHKYNLIPVFSSLLSFSRISILTFITSWILNSKRNISKVFKILSVSLLVVLFIYRFLTSDKNRILDYKTWINTITSLNINDFFFGIGHYPEFLHQVFDNLEPWQWQPQHNSILGIITQFGLIGFLSLVGWFYCDVLRAYFDNKQKKEQ